MSIRHLNFFKLLSGEVTPHNLLLKFLLLLMELQDVERGSIWVRAKDGYTCLEAVGDEEESIKGLFIPEEKDSIVGWVMQNGRPTIAAVGQDERHFKEAEEDLAVKSSLILAYPLFLKDNSVYGVVEIIDTSTDGNRMNLGQEYLDFMQNLVDIGSIALSNAVEFSGQVDANRQLMQTIRTLAGEGILSCPSEAFTHCMRLADSYAKNSYPVLITGETATGKHTLAHEIHRLGRGDNAPFVTMDVGTIPRALVPTELVGHRKGAFAGADSDKPGAFEQAAGGTLYISNVEALTSEQQRELLKMLRAESYLPLGAKEPMPIRTRIIASSRYDLAKRTANGEFMEGLFFYLNVLPLPIAPLRDRVEDISYLAAHFIRLEASAFGIEPPSLSPEVREILESHPWEGNFKELATVIKMAIATHPDDILLPRHLPPELQPHSLKVEPAPPADFGSMTWEEMERAYATHLLEKHNGTISRAAREAGLKRSTFDSRLKKLGIGNNPG